MVSSIAPTAASLGITGQFSNVMGRFDPKTQQFKEYHLRPGTNPTSLAGMAKEVTAWVSSASRPKLGGFIGEFHPRNGPYPIWAEGDVLEYPYPRSQAPRPRHRHNGYGRLVHRNRGDATAIFGWEQDWKTQYI